MTLRREAKLESRAIAAYLGLAVGDALGATVEFMTPREIHAAYGVHNIVRGGGWLRLRPGQVTDDTTMALALGQSVLDTGYVDAGAAAQAFSDWMRDKPVDIGNTVRRGITHYRYSGETEVPPSEQDAGNGACMRTLPVALATFGAAATEVQSCSRAQAHVTHNNALSDAGTECVIAMVQAALDGASKAELLQGPVRRLTHRHREFAFRRRHRDNPSAYIVETLQAVLQAFFDTDSFEGCLVDVVNRGGDADTTGAIAGMIAGSMYGLDAIPRHWLAALDRDVYRRCTEQAVALLALSPRSGAESSFQTALGAGGARP
jgi:ADP-ribosyl-[dinitrogen reductase] hydrolase